MRNGEIPAVARKIAGAAFLLRLKKAKLGANSLGIYTHQGLFETCTSLFVYTVVRMRTSYLSPKDKKNIKVNARVDTRNSDKELYPRTN